ncbi:MAG TPA: PEGA domain-containing protein, partial [Bdellovibrionales bacterium]|nr:PEGA domain-containing protein [Bdellovibrionales bacterium]
MPFILLLLCSCASLRGTRQRIKVASSPSGADIYHGDERLGTTPAFVELKRKKQDSILLRKQGFAELPVHLNTEYRWGNSFASNFIWLSPVLIGAGIGVDLWTGAAWDYEHLRVLKWDRARPLEPTPLKKVAIAPPQASNEMLSDELGELVEERARRLYAKAEIPKFVDTVNLFARYAYFHHAVTPTEYRDDLY